MSSDVRTADEYIRGWCLAYIDDDTLAEAMAAHLLDEVPTADQTPVDQVRATLERFMGTPQTARQIAYEEIEAEAGAATARRIAERFARQALNSDVFDGPDGTAPDTPLPQVLAESFRRKTRQGLFDADAWRRRGS
jgi:hypothetical protein